MVGAGFRHVGKPGPPVQNRVRIRFGVANDYSCHRADRYWRRVGLRRAHLVASGTAEKTKTRWMVRWRTYHGALTRAATRWTHLRHRQKYSPRGTMTPELINELVAVLCDDLYIEVHTAERYPPMVAFV